MVTASIIIKEYKKTYYTPIATSRLYDKIEVYHPVKSYRSMTESSTPSSDNIISFRNQRFNTRRN